MAGLKTVSLQGGVVVGWENKTLKLHSAFRAEFYCGSWLSVDVRLGRVLGEFRGLGKLAIARGTPCNEAICRSHQSFLSVPIKLLWAGKLEPTMYGPDFVEFFDGSRVEASTSPLAKVEFYQRGLLVLECADNFDFGDAAFMRQVETLVSVL